MQTHEKKDVPLDGAMPDGQVRRRRRSGQGPRTTRHSGSHPSLRDALHGVTATLVVTRPPFRGVVYYTNLNKPRKFTSSVSRRPRTPSQVEKIEQTSPKLEANSSSPQPRPDEPCNEQVYVDTSTGDKYYGKNLVVTPKGTIYKTAFQSKM